MYDGSSNWQQNDDGTWSEAIPIPFYGFLGLKHCMCGRHFLKEDKYRQHYAEAHTNNKRYNRTPTGMVEVGGHNE